MWENLQDREKVSVIFNSTTCGLLIVEFSHESFKSRLVMVKFNHQNVFTVHSMFILNLGCGPGNVCNKLKNLYNVVTEGWCAKI